MHKSDLFLFFERGGAEGFFNYHLTIRENGIFPNKIISTYSSNKIQAGWNYNFTIFISIGALRQFRFVLRGIKKAARQRFAIFGRCTQSEHLIYSDIQFSRAVEGMSCKERTNEECREQKRVKKSGEGGSGQRQTKNNLLQ